MVYSYHVSAFIEGEKGNSENRKSCMRGL